MNIDKFLQNTMVSWMTDEGEHTDIVMSTRVRLARNLTDFRFPLAFSEDEAMKVDQMVSHVLLDAEELFRAPFSYFSLKEVPALQRQVLVEKHLISPQLANAEHKGSFLLSEDEAVSVMVNEEDHIRIQCILPGFQLQKTYDQANQVDQLLEQHVPYAFDENFGYLTSCPTNTGTGLRASVMMHLPALTMTNQMQQLIQTISRLGMVARGLYGEGSEALGNIYQISNQTTLGKTERDILEELQSVTVQIIQREREARAALLEKAPLVLDDRLNRSLGVLTYARILTSEEAARCLSNVRLAVDLGLIEDISVANLNECMIVMQPGFLQQYAGTPLQPNERDVFRAKLLRERLQTNSHLENDNNDQKGEEPHDV